MVSLSGGTKSPRAETSKQESVARQRNHSDLALTLTLRGLLRMILTVVASLLPPLFISSKTFQGQEFFDLSKEVFTSPTTLVIWVCLGATIVCDVMFDILSDVKKFSLEGVFWCGVCGVFLLMIIGYSFAYMYYENGAKPTLSIFTINLILFFNALGCALIFIVGMIISIKRDKCMWPT